MKRFIIRSKFKLAGRGQQTAPASSSVPSTPPSAAGIWAAVGPYPPGYRFVPKDEELIKDYLQKKINNEPISISEISDVNLYDHHPQYLAENYPQLGEKEWYFFTPRDRRYPNGKRPRRTITGTSHWRASGADKNIVYNGEVIGKKRALNFYLGPGKTNKTSWLMYEYKINEPSRCSGGNDMRVRTFVSMIGSYGDDDIAKYIAPLLADDNNEQAPLLDANNNDQDHAVLPEDDNNEQATLIDANNNEQDHATLYIPDNNKQQYNHVGLMINHFEDNGYQLPAWEDGFNDQVLPNNSMEFGPSQVNLQGQPNFNFGMSFDDSQFFYEQEALRTIQQQSGGLQQDVWPMGNQYGNNFQPQQDNLLQQDLWAKQMEILYGINFQQDLLNINVGSAKNSDGEQLAPKRKK
ncbi:hypothetical protein DH2020_020865 [Rehmannia glutinosa]|uniref:NAC domain-containing protein n=1 Tax=Rehmannia glutinosa TaxID=99300 RepID=A0ABR0WD45_REHGL